MAVDQAMLNRSTWPITRRSGRPKDGAIALRQIARVLVDSRNCAVANRKTFELLAESWPEQTDLSATFARLEAIPPACWMVCAIQTPSR